MVVDARETAEFYASALGALTGNRLRQILLEIWPNCAGLSLLGLGYAGPYLRLWREQAARAIAVSPMQMGPAPWPVGRAGLSACAEEDMLPFHDMSFDRVLLVHGLEQADNARKTLREAWRLLKDDGRIIVIVPNRRGLWAYAESTPFGHGQPYSEGQLARALTGMFFTLEARRTALFAPPLNWRVNLKAFDVWERAGQTLAPQLAGLNIAEASKDMHAIMPVKRRTAGRRVLVEQS